MHWEGKAACCHQPWAGTQVVKGTSTCCVPSSDTHAQLFLGSFPWPACFPAHSCKWGNSALTSLELHLPGQSGEGNWGWCQPCHWGGYLGTAVFWDFLFCTSHAMGAALWFSSWRGVQASLRNPECDQQLRVWAVPSERVHCNSVFTFLKLSRPWNARPGVSLVEWELQELPELSWVQVLELNAGRRKRNSGEEGQAASKCQKWHGPFTWCSWGCWFTSQHHFLHYPLKY